MDADSIRRYEELALTAFPALSTAFHDGWILRFADGYTKRANCVNPLYPSTLDLAEKIAYCEVAYARAGASSVVFKLTSCSLPPDLDTALTERGYALVDPVSVQILALTACEPTEITEGAVTLDGRATDAWCDNYVRLSGIPARFRPIMARMLQALGVPACFLTVEVEGSTAAVALAVADGAFVGIFDVIVAREFRRRGLGEAIVREATRWGREQHAEIAYLQVTQANAPANALYRKMGFAEAYTYWYRTRTLG